MPRLAVLPLLLCLARLLPAADGACTQPPEFYDGTWILREVIVRHPFSFLRFVHNKLQALPSDQLPAKGSTLDLVQVKAGKDRIVAQQFLPSPVPSAVRVDIVVDSLENCRDNQLDLVYTVFSSQVLPSFQTSFESRAAEAVEPQQAVGLDTPALFRLVPAFHYDRASGLTAGGRLLWRVRNPALQTVAVEGAGSTSSRHLGVAMAGEGGPSRLFAHTDWQLDYSNILTPAGAQSLSSGRLAARFAAATRPLGGTPLSFRFGSSVEGGNQQTGYTGRDVAANTIANSAFGSLKLYAGLTARNAAQAFAASWGLDLGTLGASTRIQYRRHLGDIAYSASIPAGNHRAVDVESRFTAGGIQTPGRVPLAQRFFGGNLQQDFIPGDSWKIRANPVLRSIPAAQFNRVENGVGAERFFALNFTAAVPLWHRALVPTELTSDAAFQSAVDTQLSILPALLTAEYETHDPHFKAAFEALRLLPATLADLQAAITPLTVPTAQEAALKACNLRLRVISILLKDFEKKEGARRFDLVTSMVSATGELSKVLQACFIDLNAPLQNPTLTALDQKLRAQVLATRTPFDAVNPAAAKERADRETKPLLRVIHTVLNDLNLYSLSPVAVYDLARIGPASPGTAGGLRHGIGGGVRLTLVNSVSLTAGYALNPARRSFEGRGALFFDLAFRDLFQ